jgi:hypothetical protein
MWGGVYKSQTGWAPDIAAFFQRTARHRSIFQSPSQSGNSEIVGAFWQREAKHIGDRLREVAVSLQLTNHVSFWTSRFDTVMLVCPLHAKSISVSGLSGDCGDVGDFNA